MEIHLRRLDPGTAVAPSPVSCDNMFPARFLACKPHSEAAVGGGIDADQAQDKNAVDAHVDQAVRCSPQPTGIEGRRTGVVTQRLSAATLAAAHRVTLFRAEARAARAAQPMHVEPDAGRASSLASDGRTCAMLLLPKAIWLPAETAPA